VPGAHVVAARSDASARPVSAPSTHRRAPSLGWDRWDAVIVAVLVAATSVAHPVGLMLARPYWLDETWVAALTRLPYGRSLSLSSSTPVGWVTLLRWVPGDAAQRGRALTLAFAMLSSGAAYVLARGLAWRARGAARLAGVVVAVVVSCVPVAIMRNDLKQYTADAFFSLVVLIAARAVDSSSRPRAVQWLGVVAVVAALFSSTSAFVSVACFAGVLVTALLRRDRARALATLVVGGVTAIGLGAIFALTVLAHVNPALTDYWRSSYLTGGPLHMLGDAWDHLTDVDGLLAMPGAVFLAGFALGVAALVRLRASAVAIAVPLVWVEMMIAGRLERYPFLERRTFHFLLVTTVAVIAVGVVWALLQLARRSVVAGSVAAIVSIGLFAAGVDPHWRELSVPNQDVRSQVEVVARDATPDDIILVTQLANWGFAYYWPKDPAFATEDDSVAAGYVMGVRNPNVVVARGRDDPAVLDALQEAVARQRRSPGSRIFIVRMHWLGEERSAWSQAFHALGLQPRTVPAGLGNVLVIDPSR
jgi:hypothetical protein